MKRAILSIGLVILLLYVYTGWIDVEVPDSIDELNNDLDQHALAYEVVEGTPLIVAEFGNSVFLDELQLVRISKNIPPRPEWQWTGNWERVSDPGAIATAEISAEFGPTVLFGVVNDVSITSVRIVRDGATIESYEVRAPAFIIPVVDVKRTDNVEFLDADGTSILEINLMD